jgi:hypothetical protein
MLSLKGGKANLPATEETIIDKTTNIEKLQAAALKRNVIAIANLTMSFTTDGIMSLTHEAKDDEWPCGLTHKVALALEDKYQPQDTMTRVELRQMLNKVVMKKINNPAMIFEQISAIKDCYNMATKKFYEDTFIVVVQLTQLCKSIRLF